MKINDYQDKAMRTAPDISNQELLCNGVMGLAGESGEVCDIVKKHIFHGHPLDIDHVAKELGDVCWYIALIAKSINYDLETIMRLNIWKLEKRYPEGFDKEKSLHRDKNDL